MKKNKVVGTQNLIKNMSFFYNVASSYSSARHKFLSSGILNEQLGSLVMNTNKLFSTFHHRHRQQTQHAEAFFANHPIPVIPLRCIKLYMSKYLE